MMFSKSEMKCDDYKILFVLDGHNTHNIKWHKNVLL